MKRICCYCKKEYGNPTKLPPGLPKGSVTHGICPKCLPQVEKELEDYLKIQHKIKEFNHE